MLAMLSGPSCRSAELERPIRNCLDGSRTMTRGPSGSAATTRIWSARGPDICSWAVSHETGTSIPHLRRISFAESDSGEVGEGAGAPFPFASTNRGFDSTFFIKFGSGRGGRLLARLLWFSLLPWLAPVDSLTIMAR